MDGGWGTKWIESALLQGQDLVHFPLFTPAKNSCWATCPFSPPGTQVVSSVGPEQGRVNRCDSSVSSQLLFAPSVSLAVSQSLCLNGGWKAGEVQGL